MSNQATTHSSQANQLFKSKAAFTATQSQDFTSYLPLHSYINTGLTDEEILNGDSKFITQEHILQVSTTHTAEEIANRVSTADDHPALTPKLTYHRINTACKSVAIRNDIPFEMVKMALNNARIESGVMARIHATLGRAAGTGDASNIDVAMPSKKGNNKGSDTSLTEIDDSKVNYLGDFFSSDSTMRAANPLFKRIAKGGSKLPENEDLIRLAARYTVREMVEMVQDADPMTTITNTKISARIMDALSMFATARALPRDVVKKEFEIAKQANGVVMRHYQKIGDRRKKTTGAKKAGIVKKKTVSFVSPPTVIRSKSESSEEGESFKEYYAEEGEDELDQLPLQWTSNQDSATPSPELDYENDTLMTDDSDEDTINWLDDPEYAQYKLASSQSDIYSENLEMEKRVAKESFAREEAAIALLEMRWKDEPELDDEGAAMVLMRIHAEAQKILKGVDARMKD